MKRIQLEKWVTVGAALVIGLSAASTARALDNSALDMLAYMHQKPDHFVLFNNGIEPLDFSTPHFVRICLQPQRATPSRAEILAEGSPDIASANPVPLAVRYDGNMAIVRPGECLGVKARHVTVRPNGELDRDARDVPLTHHRHPDLYGTISAF